MNAPAPSGVRAAREWVCIREFHNSEARCGASGTRPGLGGKGWGGVFLREMSSMWLMALVLGIGYLVLFARFCYVFRGLSAILRILSSMESASSIVRFFRITICGVDASFWRYRLFILLDLEMV